MSLKKTSLQLYRRNHKAEVQTPSVTCDLPDDCTSSSPEVSTTTLSPQGLMDCPGSPGPREMRNLGLDQEKPFKFWARLQNP